MNLFTKRIFMGMIIWTVPFVISVLVWDPKIRDTRIGDWFNHLMTFALAVGLAIALVFHFKDVKTKTFEEGWKTGVTWFIQLAILDFLVLVNLFGMETTRYFQILLAYLGVVAITAAVGYVKK